jgi:DNA repair protein RadC
MSKDNLLQKNSQVSPYNISKNNDLVLGNPLRKYILKIHDLPLEEKPREKMLIHGPGVLSTKELLAVILTTGTKKEDVLTMTERIMKEYGEKSIMNSSNASSLAQDLDIPLGKATQIVAAGELGRRFFQKNNASLPTVRTAYDVFNHTQDMRYLAKEHLRGLYLNAHYKVIHDEIISIGTVDSNLTHPREVFKPALEYAAVAVILAHNHPSNILIPSKADIQVTKQLVEAGNILGIDLIDHIIVTRKGFTSIITDKTQQHD